MCLYFSLYPGVIIDLQKDKSPSPVTKHFLSKHFALMQEVPEEATQAGLGEGHNWAELIEGRGTCFSYFVTFTSVAQSEVLFQ